MMGGKRRFKGRGLIEQLQPGREIFDLSGHRGNEDDIEE